MAVLNRLPDVEMDADAKACKILSEPKSDGNSKLLHVPSLYKNGNQDVWQGDALHGLTSKALSNACHCYSWQGLYLAPTERWRILVALRSS